MSHPPWASPGRGHFLLGPPGTGVSCTTGLAAQVLQLLLCVHTLLLTDSTAAEDLTPFGIIMGDLWAISWVILGFMPALLGAVTIQEQSTETILLPKGDSVTLGCTYVLEPFETGALDIEWSLMNPDSTGLDKVILTYMDNAVVSKAPQSLMNRLSFRSADPSQGDASITITFLEVGDSGTFQCKVKKNPGVASRKVTLVVQASPSNPQCYIEGDHTKGSDVVLKCKSSEGTPPLTYRWEKIAGPSNPVTPVLNMAPINGDLLIKNLSEPYTGAYQCTVGNRVGSGTCVVDLSISSGEKDVTH
ncbi:hypothetical protein GDO78_010167 [Eleutherodactylus coqui]|uniref:Ig-like domain-containing protein n=1 Tax=Eleutherodactylus coqui TaxID=57060 RepID=A0A8J6K6A7_ELECQ|nr:hypothetical protein GDO78_010167 [Eleutherodactylus coqui]